MARIVEHKTGVVTLGVLDRNLTAREDLHQVTFDDVFGTRHTVHAHKSGPYTDAESVVRAFEDGTLHPFETHEAAAQYEEDRGNKEHAERLRALGEQDKDNANHDNGGAF